MWKLHRKLNFLNSWLLFIPGPRPLNVDWDMLLFPQYQFDTFISLERLAKAWMQYLCFYTVSKFFPVQNSLFFEKWTNIQCVTLNSYHICYKNATNDFQFLLYQINVICDTCLKMFWFLILIPMLYGWSALDQV